MIRSCNLRGIGALTVIATRACTNDRLTGDIEAQVKEYEKKRRDKIFEGHWSTHHPICAAMEGSPA
eukprot:scaffold196829_cov18-Prasinocladus_malaysianus.AAC.1